MARLQGSLVAIVTPMLEDGALDFGAFRQLIDWHISEGTQGIVVVGTTAHGKDGRLEFVHSHTVPSPRCDVLWPLVQPLGASPAPFM